MMPTRPRRTIWMAAMLSVAAVCLPEAEAAETQSGYRWFANTDAEDVGAALADLNSAARAPAQGTPFRLRMLLHVDGAQLDPSDDSFTKLSDPATLPTNSGRPAAFSPDGTYLAIPHITSPFVTIYKRAGDTFTKLSDPATLPAGTGRGAAFSPDGTYLAIGHSTSPFITIYKRAGDTFTKLSDPATLPTGFGKGVVFSPDGTYLAIAHFNSPFVTIYKRAGDTGGAGSGTDCGRQSAGTL